MRHETELDKEVIKEYQEACNEINRSMRQQTAYLITEFLKKRRQKIKRKRN